MSLSNFSHPRASFLLAVLAICSAGCDQPAATQSGSVPVKPEAARYAVQYPQLAPELAPLDHAMHDYAIAVQKKFDTDLTALTDTAAGPPPHLAIEFNVATRTQDFVSSVANGEADLGDLHPQPVLASFTEHLPSGRIVALNDLFTDAQATLNIFSDEARRRLAPDLEAKRRQANLATPQLTEQLKQMRDMLDKGTAPEAGNFSVFLIDGVDGKAIGVTLQFRAGQVAAIADGPQQVEVPSKLFYAQLKPEYRDAFDVDKEALPPGDAKSADAR